jgi:ABC-type antimicrobial peptide transport system, ATPase component
MNIVCTDLQVKEPLGGALLDIPRWSAQSGDQLAITGPSGAGKSTLLSVLAGLRMPTLGCVRVGDDDLTRLSTSQVAAYRSDVLGLIMQEAVLFEELSVWNNLRILNTCSRTPIDLYRARRLLEAVALNPTQLTVRLSGGERQRLALVRCLVRNPQIVLADEPTANLDEHNAQLVMGMLLEYSTSHRATLVVVSHESRVLSQFARIDRLDRGKLEGGNGLA